MVYRPGSEKTIMPSLIRIPVLAVTAGIAVFAGMAVAGRAAAADPDFQREIQPILAEHCGHCHAVDEQSRQGDLRLDVRAAALEGGSSGLPAIVPGRPAESEMMRRVRSTDTDEIMPPPHEKKPLSAAQIELLERWIAAGARYEPHWAFVAPREPSVPAAAAHPVDAFVRARLASTGLQPAPPADDATLCRRLYLDLVGLPPSPEDLAAFARDGYERTVDKLLASERFGEKWARPWLDLARYSDTNGYEKDLRREMWAWRDWVIAAFNRDMPYDQFVLEQIAGDMLPDASQDQIVATAFLRNSMLNEEGAIIPEEFRMAEMFDRMDCVGKAVLGLTTQCAQCHTHKFDPLTQAEYYGMFAFLNNSFETRSNVYDADGLAALRALKRDLAAADARVRQTRPDWAAEMADWERRLAPTLVDWTPVTMLEMSSSALLTHPVQLEDKSILMLGHRDKTTIFEAAPDLAGATGLQLEALNHGDLFLNGPGRDGPWSIAELKVELKRPDADAWETVKLVNATADWSHPDEVWTSAAANAKEPVPDFTAGAAAKLIDGDDSTGWYPDRGPLLRHQPSVAVVEFEKPLDAPAGTHLRVSVKHSQGPALPGDFNSDRTTVVGCLRISLTKTPQPVAPSVAHGAVLAMRKPADRRTPEDHAALFAAWRLTVPELAGLNAEIAALWKGVPEPLTTVFHLAERPADVSRPTFLLDRGAWNQPKERVEPHVPAAFHPFPADAPRNRLGFARWLVARESPLTARVAVNRIWHGLFGDGLVETPDDLGTRAPVPEHRELLDWLAVDFMDHGWSQKHVIRTIVTSDTYRRSSVVSAETRARDPMNRLLARGPRFRVDAELVRDVALAAAGLITHAFGGPGVIPPVPQNVLDYNYVYPTFWKPATGPDRYRRAVYMFRKRSMPDPALGSFDAPNGDLSCARRLRSNTPLAALTGLNEPVFVEAARALALRTLREGGADDAGRIDHAFLLCTSRRPTAEEKKELLAFLAAQRQRIADGWIVAREVAAGEAETLGGLPPGATPQDAAAWTLVSRILLNLDETVTKN
jgi:cytochrome c553